MIWRVSLGIASIVAAMVVIGYVAATEQDRMASFNRAYESRNIENGAALYSANCKSCHGPKGEGIPGVAPALNAPDLFNGERFAEIGWPGTVEAYVRSAVAAGRPRAAAAFANYPQRMPAWGQDYGGPLRKDQVEALVAYTMNYRLNWVDSTGRVPPSSDNTSVITDPVGVDITIALPPGDAKRGEELVTAKGCIGCHVGAGQLLGPAWLSGASADGKSVAQHAAERFTATGYTGKATTAEQYLLEAIVAPNAYLVPGYAANLMPQNYGETLRLQEAADMIAYLLTIK